MRRLTVLAFLPAFLAADAAAQFQEEVLDVPTHGSAGSQEETDEADAGLEADPEATGAETELEAATDDWRAVASPFDIERIDADPAAYAKALAIARRVGSPANRAELARILADLPEPVQPDDLTGRWACRTIRITDEPESLRIFDWFDCQVSFLTDGYLLEKLGGSELTSGFLYPESETRMIYLGHAHSRAEPALDYDGAGGPEGDVPENPDDPGILTQRGPERLLLAKPLPVGAPVYDFLELRKP